MHTDGGEKAEADRGTGEDELVRPRIWRHGYVSTVAD